MTADLQNLLNWSIPTARQKIAPKDVMLYGLAIGLGGDPLDERQLRYVYESDLRVAPTMAAVLAYPGFWQKEPGTGLDWVRLLHAEQSIEIHAPLPTNAELIGTTRITGVVDKGADKGSLMYQSRDITNAETNELIATSSMTSFCRGDGGIGNFGAAPAPAAEIPDTPADAVCDMTTLPQSALLYRLCGDMNPLHVDPSTARAAGFDRPILHGLCTFGVCGHAILKAICDYDGSRLKSMRVRFSAPVYPGETLRTEFWRVTPTDIRFRSRIVERDLLVLNNGQALLTP
ncbi:MAG TPA: 3-alpha,7-alpha,12-alpha-trihydroxy-5-beta-cholest-24-enoyl-CoA hydratase [Rhodospirillaceae bacterium]|nr:3-alpha,7-alpha,12-alpha-trihydroxy-5-beta-cholest-24-enoyl-CoA hydratase [Rhodospirillaceae bacterium]MAX62661.1 3-alpha,7-alpha,12-alpha-trihydroxy-5-beta-cholest-24-enoyl-CoA hydratase [Rhodospirillaceae bacterium]MBB57061.1 3-alpha,7-alpha,12-alpha-trihydroxy-5-beta-cholest-24-enoyl-CoA hydratase [Rhodospirillaceae bacterium]HAE02870.1 3-alpha,7-alpha,12-alpha-trihydroxy-5-beta-cholest-24-enoyl-CoA hydratase [Rhodospirillaceae bacterium]HBM12550.1 3-alpha,7-alpha,12-alpha-trihydroxy-5-be|tara:strand:- start:73295 stop:74158 length:864 start_codon:yes stop_codon:yes gene_type:complete